VTRVASKRIVEDLGTGAVITHEPGCRAIQGEVLDLPDDPTDVDGIDVAHECEVCG